MSDIDDILKDALAFDVEDLDLGDDEVDLDIGDIGNNIESKVEENDDDFEIINSNKKKEEIEEKNQYKEVDDDEEFKNIEEFKIEEPPKISVNLVEEIEEKEKEESLKDIKEGKSEQKIEIEDDFLEKYGFNLDDFNADDLVRELSQRGENPENEVIEAIVQKFDSREEVKEIKPVEDLKEDIPISIEKKERIAEKEKKEEVEIVRKFFLPHVDFKDEVVIDMNNDFKIDDTEMKHLVKERFHPSKKNVKNPIKRKYSTNIMNKQTKKKEENKIFTCLDIMDSMDKKIKEKSEELKETVEKRKKDYFSSLQDGEWAANHQDISPIEVELSKGIHELIEGKHEGKIISFACSVFTTKQYLFGTKKGEILEIIQKNNKLKIYNLEGEILTLDVCIDDSIWAAGTSKSEILIKKALGGWAKKTVNSFNSRPIIQLRFIDKSQLIVATDTTVSILSLKDLKYSFDLKLTRIIEKKTNIVQVMYMPTKEGKGLVIAAQLDQIYFSRLDSPEDYQTIERPNFIEEGYAPILSWVIQEDKNIRNIIVFWKNLLLMITENDSGEFSISAQKFMEINVTWGTVLGNRIVCMIDENYEMQLQSVEYLFATFSSGGGFGGAHQLPKERLLDSRIVGVRKDGGFIRSSVERIRCLKDAIGFLSDKGLYKAKLLSIKDLSQKYIEKGKWLPALRLCVEVFKGKIVATQNEKDEVHEITPELTLKYIDNFMKGDKHDKNLMESITKVSIESLFETGNLGIVFSSLSEKIDNLIFWKQIEDFVLNGKIKVIPPAALVKGSIYLQSNTLQLLLLQISIEELKADEESFHQILMFIKKRKLWLPYIRISLNTPKQSIKILLSSLMIDMMNLQPEEKKEQILILKENQDIENLLNNVNFGDTNITTSMYRIFWILRKILNPNGIEESVEEVPKQVIWEETLTWLFEDKNSDILCKGFPQLYFEILYDVFLNHEIMMFNNESILKSLIKIYDNYVKRTKTKEGVKTDEDFLAYNKPKWFLGNSEEALKTLNMSKVLLLLIEIKLNDFEHEPWIAFFFLKILNISMFASLFNEKEWVDHHLRVFLKSDKKDYWMYYKSAEIGDIEEQVVRIFKRGKYEDEDLKEYGELAKRNE